MTETTHATDMQVTSVEMYLLPVETRVPLKFGSQTLRHVHCARIRIEVCSRTGEKAVGWGETPLSVQWAWPSDLPYEVRYDRMITFCKSIANTWANNEAFGHPMELGYDFLQNELPNLNKNEAPEPMPLLSALVCASAFDIALHDAYGNLHDIDIYKTYNKKFMNRDLAAFLEPAADVADSVSFANKYPEDFLVAEVPTKLPAWHLVGGLDPIDPADLTGDEPDDGVPVLLRDWITTDGLKCLKIKLRGNDAAWDYDRLLKVGHIALELGVDSLSTDFNCCVREPEYVNEILDKLAKEEPAIFERVLYVEQPFGYELEEDMTDVHSVSERSDLFLDESAHDWQHVRLGRELGWTGVALKTCKTQTGALLSCCWAKAHGMPLMVQDLTNPMLAQIPHVRLAAHVGTIRGVETNGMQFYPAASEIEAAVHPGIYVRRNGEVDLSTIAGPGFGYRLDEIERQLPEVSCRMNR